MNTWALAATAFGLAATSCAIAAPVSIITNPDWVKKPTASDIVSAWPRAALLRGVQGRVELSCEVNPRGLAENCVVASETPPGMGFGASALTLTSQFQFRPATRDGKPFRSRVSIPVNFKTSGPLMGNDQVTEFSLLRDPIWAHAPLFSDMEAAYPRGGNGATGIVTLRCTAKPDGSLHICDTIHESPQGRGFGSAGQHLTKLFHLDTTGLSIKAGQSLRVDIPIRFVDPKSPEFAAHAIGEPEWIAFPDPKTARAFPDAAAKAGYKMGSAVLHCAVTPDGALTACDPASTSPPSLGFAEMGLKVAAVMRMNRWTKGGGPIDGSKIVLPLRFNLRPDSPAAKPASPAVKDPNASPWAGAPAS